ncbi:L-fucose/L-arabinose isomerase family protein [Arenibacter sp. M-2]|uniref:L-arabinose isomerase n=1 Tax=Arenibacter algicola TaxID=616991 RepID=A0A221UZA7_9FLAO|nr:MULTISPECIES: L-fucose/L-arabinose isomerase family protein [Arenibacter]ASO06478.1 L-arabinose isomerase [Arenibacter algicola]MDL5512885.1 L-fucose/L-arabinose isomerase family protein [Arenibacter sp. M-2]|tara:strand:+ start:2509 stop:3960 length:1452 start_codon:yes stop_codon:yes gene_type:complete
MKFNIKKEPQRIGVFGVGYDVYWGQFDGLLDELMGKHSVLLEKLSDKGAEIVDFGMIDNPKKAYVKLKDIQSANLDLVFCNMLTYATSGTFGIIVKSLSIPIVMVAMQPRKALDYSKASTYMQLVNDDICALPEFAGVAARMGKKVPDMIIGTLYDDDHVDKRIDEYCRIAKVLHDLKNVHLGHIGHPLNAMLDMHTDATMLTSIFGSHVVQCEANEIMSCYDRVTEEEIKMKEQQILDFFDTPDPVSDPISLKLIDEDLRIAAKVSIALEKFVVERNIDGLAYYYDGPPNSELRRVMSNLIVGNSILTSNGFPMCGESDLKTLIAMLIMDRLGIGGSFAEFHPVDFNDDFVLVGHDGPHNISIADGKPILRSLKKYHGKPGNGAGVEFKIKEGPITMLSINSTYDGKFKFVIAEGQSIKGAIPPTGNTNTRGHFKPDVRSFLYKWMAEGPTHHFALGIGHHAQSIAKIANYLNIESVIISEN